MNCLFYNQNLIRVPHVEQELFTLPERLVFFLCSVLYIECIFVLFLLVFVLSVLRFTACDYPFDFNTLVQLFLVDILRSFHAAIGVALYIVKLIIVVCIRALCKTKSQLKWNDMHNSK